MEVEEFRPGTQNKNIISTDISTINVSGTGREEGGGREWTNIQAPRTISGDEYRILKTFFNRRRKGKSKWIDKNICKFPLLCSPPLEKYN